MKMFWWNAGVVTMVMVQRYYFFSETMADNLWIPVICMTCLGLYSPWLKNGFVFAALISIYIIRFPLAGEHTVGMMLSYRIQILIAIWFIAWALFRLRQLAETKDSSVTGNLG